MIQKQQRICLNSLKILNSVMIHLMKIYSHNSFANKFQILAISILKIYTFSTIDKLLIMLKRDNKSRHCQQYQTKSISLLWQTDCQTLFPQEILGLSERPQGLILSFFCNSSTVIVEVRRAGVCDITTPYLVCFIKIK